MESLLDATFLGSVGGAAVVASLVAQWVKRYMEDHRIMPLVVLALALALEQFIYWVFELGDWRLALLAGMFGATFAVFGYESINNILGIYGIGKRSNQ